MAKNDNFKWLVEDIYSTIVLKVFYKKDAFEEEYGVFGVSGVFNTLGEDFDVETANIDDLTNLLTLSIVRFVNVIDKSDILDIPFRNLYLLYKTANVLGEDGEEKLISFKELDTFSIIDGTIKNDYLVFSAVISKVPEELDEVMKIASEFGQYGMQEKLDALNRITVINHRRLMLNNKNR